MSFSLNFPTHFIRCVMLSLRCFLLILWYSRHPWGKETFQRQREFKVVIYAHPPNPILPLLPAWAQAHALRGRPAFIYYNITKSIGMSILLVISYLFGISNCISEDEDPTIWTLTYNHGIKLDSIQTPGIPYTVKQFCTTEIDSVISSGNIIFKGSKVGKIKKCNLQWQIREDTLRAIVIETLGEKYTQQVIKQAENQFGLPEVISSPPITTYEWRRKLDSTEMKVFLTVTTETGACLLTVTIGSWHGPILAKAKIKGRSFLFNHV